MIRGPTCSREEERGLRWIDSCSQELVTRDSAWGVFQEEGWMLARN